MTDEDIATEPEDAPIAEPHLKPIPDDEAEQLPAPAEVPPLEEQA